MVVFISMTVIKQNNMTYQHKVIFYIWDGYGFGVGTYIPVTRPIPVFRDGKAGRPAPSKSAKNETRRTESNLMTEPKIPFSGRPAKQKKLMFFYNLIVTKKNVAFIIKIYKRMGRK